MKQSTYNSLKNFIWSIANECLVDVYDVGDYRKVILPMLVIRRFDAVLEPFHDKVLEEKKYLETLGLTVGSDGSIMKKITGQNFFNTSNFILKDFISRTDPQNLEKDFRIYLNGFSKNVEDIIEKFHFSEQIPRLVKQNRLGLLIGKFCDPDINFSNKHILNNDGSIKLEALDNHSMGTLFEEVIRMFNEHTNVTDAGRHFTPRDIVELMADLAFIPIQDEIKDSTYMIYDGACGTGGMLTVSEARIKELAQTCGKDVSIFICGQENSDETFAIACADMLLKGEDTVRFKIEFGSTISDDKFFGKTFDFMLSNPPFGTSWKAEFNSANWKSFEKKSDITDTRFLLDYEGDPEFSLLPDIGDPQMLFLANNLSKMKKLPLGSRIIEVHNGSSLFTGSAGSGSSNLRRFIIERDMLEAIVALPEKMFYNTGIGTYLWIVTNKKNPRRKGFVQLIDATSLKAPLRKNLGEKNCEISPDIRNKISQLLVDFDKADPALSKIFPNDEFGFYSADILRPLRLRVTLDENIFPKINDSVLVDALTQFKFIFDDKFSLDYNSFTGELEKILSAPLNKKRLKILRDNFTRIDPNAAPVKLPDGSFEPDNNLKDTEQIPLSYDGGINSFFENEIKPFVPDAWIDDQSVVIGYEITFTKYFYSSANLRTAAEIISDLQSAELDAADLLKNLLEDLQNA